jgi:DNA-binding Lrp family transcriptional regulator
MNEIARQGDRRMTVREVAEALNVSEQTIRYHMRNLYPELVKNGVTTFLNEEQATAIKGLIGTGRNDLQNILQVKNSFTDLEAAEMLLKSAQHFKTRFDPAAIDKYLHQNRVAAGEDYEAKRLLARRQKRRGKHEG